MLKERYRVRQLEYCNKQMFGNLIVTCSSYASEMPKELIQPVPITVKPVIPFGDLVNKHLMEAEKRRTSILVDQLLMEIHNSFQHSTDYNSTTSGRSSQKYSNVESNDLFKRDLDDLAALVVLLKGQIERVGVKLVRRLKRREALRRQQEAHCDVITCQLKKLLPNTTEDMCFTVDPQVGESGFSQWVAAMKMVSQLPGGIPPEFRKRLWLTMADKHLASKGIDWTRVERTCFSEWSHPDDGELGVQIVKDLHRTGCSLFCGEGGQENQALLKKVLLAYARWNKAVGYCQGFNMLAALILQVTDKSETDALKLMIYLIEGVLPDSYFADSLRGLSVDMAVFRELLRTRLPRLSKHLDLLQNLSKEGTSSYEPPLTNVFTMQWFLTLFCNCLPQPSVLRIWDLILLEGNEVLLRTALAIWQTLADRILRVKTADEFYCIMGILTHELLENNLIDANSLIKSVVTIGALTELKSLREHYMYNINPWGAMPSPIEFSEKQLRLYPKERLALDINTLKKQYLKLRQRQRQAHIIFTAAISRQPPPRAPVAMNHLLLGKSALISTKRLGPPKGSIPPARVPTTIQWKETSKNTSSSSSSDTELCDDNDPPSNASDELDDNPLPELPQDNLAQSELTLQSPIQDHSLISEEFTQSTDPSVLPKVLDDSEDDSVDFELFLADRVKSLEQTVSPTEEDKRVGLSRRNSERALQIIQENSLILHRILQCQSRISLSPTEKSDANNPSESSRYAGDGSSSISSSAKPELPQDLIDLPLPETPEDHSDVAFMYTTTKFEEILEKSRSLNDKFYTLIQNQPPPAVGEVKQGVPESKTFTNEEELIVLTESATPTSESLVRPWLNELNLLEQEEVGSGCQNLNQPTIAVSPSASSVSSYWSKDFITDTSSLSSSNTITIFGDGDTSTSTTSYTSQPFDIPLSSMEKKSLSATNSVDISEDFGHRRSLSASCPIKSIITSENQEDINTRLRGNIYSPDLLTEDTSRSHSRSRIGSGEIESPPSWNQRTSPCSSKSLDDRIRSYKTEESPYSFHVGSSDTSNLEPKDDFRRSRSPRRIFEDLEETKNQSSLGRCWETRSNSSSPFDSTSWRRSGESCLGSSSQLSSEDLSRRLSPLSRGESSPKSPTKVFNPFPVSLSSRQNKDIPVKLGLYKK